jgi:hypothetical protein
VSGFAVVITDYSVKSDCDVKLQFERPMTIGDVMGLLALVEKSADPDSLRYMIGFAAERLMALEVGAPVRRPTGRSALSAWRSAMATEIETGRRERLRWS